MKRKTNTVQLEISITATTAKRDRRVQPCRPPRARWWFDQMRRIVDQAVDWPPRAPLPPQQISLPLTREHQERSLLEA